MSSRTYYDILGVSRDATLEEITSAKNALAKVYHPDANMHKDIDTTAFMQEILEAYRVLSNPAKRKAYNLEIFGVTDRVFKTFKLTPEDEKESVSFVTYWNAAVQLQDIIDQSVRVMERASRTKTLSQKLMKKLGKNDPDEIHAGNASDYHIENGRNSKRILEYRCHELGAGPLGAKTGYRFPKFVQTI